MISQQEIKNKLSPLLNLRSKWGKRIDYFIQFLVIASLIAFSIETLPDLDQQELLHLHYFEVFCIVVFTIEYALRIYLSPKPWEYIKSFYGIIDLIAIMPFYLTVGVDLSGAKLFRIFRVFRLLKMVRYNRAMLRFQKAFTLVKEEIVLYLIFLIILIYFSSAGIYIFEREAQPEKFGSIFHSLWWAICTITTLGYGDVVPMTIPGRIFTLFVLLSGIGTVTIPAGLVASAMSKVRMSEE